MTKIKNDGNEQQKENKGALEAPAGVEEHAQVLRHGLRAAELKLSSMSLELALRVHTELRLGGDPYWSHVVGVTEIAFNLRKMLGTLADEVCATCLLHDTIEDKPDIEPEVETLLGRVDPALAGRMRLNLRLISKTKAGVEGSRIPDEAYFSGMHGNVPVVIAKALDQLHNLSTAEPWKLEKRLAYCDKIERLLLPAMRATRRSHPEHYDVLVLLSQWLRMTIRLVRMAKS